MRIYLVSILILGFAIVFSGCSDVIPTDSSSTGPYDIQQKTRLQNNFIPVMDVNITGTPKDLTVELKFPNDNVTSKQIFADNFTGQSKAVTFSLAEPGKEVTTGGYEINLMGREGVVSSKSFTLEGYDLVVEDDEFNITGNTINSIALTIKNEGDLPCIVQRADVVVDERGPEGSLFTVGLSPQESTTITIEPVGLDIKDETAHVNVWFYYHGEMIASHETDVSAQ